LISGRVVSKRGEEGPWPFDHRAYTVRLRAKLPSTRQALNGAVDRVMQIAGRCKCRGRHRTDLEIALREALANAITHGNALLDGKRIYLRCYGRPRSGMLIIVRDEGAGFDPRGVPDPRDADRRHLEHGRGLLLMRELMDYVEYRRGGREVVLYKTCAARQR
jgi:serine/threonine-protein kinase RsbW